MIRDLIGDKDTVEFLPRRGVELSQSVRVILSQGASFGGVGVMFSFLARSVVCFTRPLWPCTNELATSRTSALGDFLAAMPAVSMRT